MQNGVFQNCGGPDRCRGRRWAPQALTMSGWMDEQIRTPGSVPHVLSPLILPVGPSSGGLAPSPILENIPCGVKPGARKCWAFSVPENIPCHQPHSAWAGAVPAALWSSEGLISRVCRPRMEEGSGKEAQQTMNAQVGELQGHWSLSPYSSSFPEDTSSRQ